MLPSCAQFSAKSILTGALTPERAFVHSCVHGYHGSWLDIIHPFSTLGLDQTTKKIRENVNTVVNREMKSSTTAGKDVIEPASVKLETIMDHQSMKNSQAISTLRQKSRYVY
ncbi:unnamed protein product [Brassica oleracea var. botrytis]